LGTFAPKIKFLA